MPFSRHGVDYFSRVNSVASMDDSIAETGRYQRSRSCVRYNRRHGLRQLLDMIQSFSRVNIGVSPGALQHRLLPQCPSRCSAAASQSCTDVEYRTLQVPPTEENTRRQREIRSNTTFDALTDSSEGTPHQITAHCATLFNIAFILFYDFYDCPALPSASHSLSARSYLVLSAPVVCHINVTAIQLAPGFVLTCSSTQNVHL